MQMISSAHALKGAPADITGETVWLSILIPVYNVAPFIAECLQSIAVQLVDGVEVILLDDASTDGSMAACEAFCAGGRFALFANPENLGIGATRNALLSRARGDYLWFIDSDDAVEPGSIARLRQVTAAHRPDVILCDYRWKGRRHASFDGQPDSLQHDTAALVRGVFANRRFHLWSKVLRRSLWGADLRFPVVRCFEDVAVTPRLLLRAASHYYVAEPWIRYRVRPNSLMGLVSRTAGKFDVEKNDSLTIALDGYPAAIAAALPDVDDATLLAVANFCAREFTKISARRISAPTAHDWRAVRKLLRRYRDRMERCSPLPFDALLAAYRSRGQIGRWMLLKFFVLLAGRR